MAGFMKKMFRGMETPAEEKKEAGKALNEILKHRTLRQESTTGKIYFKGTRK